MPVTSCELGLRLVPGLPFGRDLREGWRGPVFLGEGGRSFDGPLYPDLRIVPEHVPFGTRVVLPCYLVGEERLITGDEEAVGEAFGDVELALVLRGEDDRFPLPEGRRA